MSKFTGERVIPGQVDADLLNEHLARYAFAARRAAGARVLDAGCGVGYGSALLAGAARRVVGVEIDAGAVEAARRQYPAPGLDFLRADCRRLPFPDASFDLVVAFELIEHLEDPDALLAESRRVLTAPGELILSTPNRIYYAESRTHPNPFHVREFNFEELSAALGAHFPHVQIFLENHADSVVFAPEYPAGAQTAIEPGPLDPNASHFFVAVCSAAPLEQSAAFLYVPRSGNILREREKHIALLEAELEQKNRWLEDAKKSLDELHRRHQALEQEAAEERARAQQIIGELGQENVRKTEWTRQVEEEVERLKAEITRLQGELDAQTQWALKLDAERAEILASYQRLDEEASGLRTDLKTTVDQLHSTEAELAARTAWAQSLDRQNQELTADLNSLYGSWAYRIGKRIGLTPVPPSDPKAGKG